MKVGIVTINDNNNYGNRLQNYALQETLKKINIDAITLRNEIFLNSKRYFVLRIPKMFIYKIKNKKNRSRERYNRFKEFNNNIKYSNKLVTPYSKISEKYDYFIAGSDQIWKPTYGRLRDVDLLSFAKNNQKISYAASFGIDSLPEEKKEYTRKNLSTFKAISVREDAGKKIVEEVTNRNDVEVLIDPTMLLTEEEWDKVSKKPKELKTDRYILNYFLGNLSDDRKKEINRIARENNCEVINIMDKNGPFYTTGPSEFLYLEKNAFLICTDSFHSSVFALIYNRPFIVFDRDDNRVNMSSRINTLISKFKLENRKFINEITDKNLKHDYTKAYTILDNERKKSMNFLKNSLKIKEGELSE